MSNRIFIDPQVFAEKGQQLHGKVLLADLDERAWSHDLMSDVSPELSYILQGGKDKLDRYFLLLNLSGNFPLQCQRCMQAVDFVLDESVRIVLFADEMVLDEAMFADEELEGIVITKELDIFTLLEDQLLMALPFAPKHEFCTVNEAAVQHDSLNPFKVLAGLKKTD